jgi:hypothetical protein
MTHPIATYRERRFDGKRTFELFADRVQIRGSTQLSSDFEISVPLKTLNPTPMRLRLRNKSFWAGTWMLLGSVIGSTVLFNALHVSYASPAFVLVAVVGAGGCALMLATARKVEFASFQSTAGVHVLDVARSGPDAGQLDAFVQLVVSGIQTASSED